MSSNDDNTQADTSLADDILEGLRQAIEYARGEASPGTVIVHELDTSSPEDAEQDDR
jgi:hypothetical protein